MNEEMIKVVIDKDEWYPVYTFAEITEYNAHRAINIPKSLHDKWVTIESDFDKVQEELSHLIEPEDE